MYCSLEISSRRATASIHFGGPSNLAKIPDGCFVNHYVAGIVGPFGAEFLIAKARLKANHLENLRQDLSLFNGCFNLPARLVPPLLALVLVSHGPLLAVFADSEQGAALA